MIRPFSIWIHFWRKNIDTNQVILTLKSTENKKTLALGKFLHINIMFIILKTNKFSKTLKTLLNVIENLFRKSWRSCSLIFCDQILLWNLRNFKIYVSTVLSYLKATSVGVTSNFWNWCLSFWFSLLQIFCQKFSEIC